MNKMISDTECSLDISKFGIKIFQPKIGFRFSIDSVLLGEFVNKNIPYLPQKILDVGIGVGTALLHTVRRRKNDNIFGIDINKNILSICNENFILNKIENSHLINEDIKNFPLKSELFDIVITNPPFYKKQEGRISRTKEVENHETLSLDMWIKFCLKRLKQKGSLYMIHLPSRLPEILHAINKIAGAVEITPIRNKNMDTAKRIILKCKKDSKSPLILHESIII